MAESLGSGKSADASNNLPLAKDDKSNSDKDNTSIDDMAEWERRLAEGDLPEDFLEVTEPQTPDQPVSTSQPKSNAQQPSTGLLVDLIPTVTATNSVVVAQERVPPPASLQGIHLHCINFKYSSYSIIFRKRNSKRA